LSQSQDAPSGSNSVSPPASCDQQANAGSRSRSGAQPSSLRGGKELDDQGPQQPKGRKKPGKACSYTPYSNNSQRNKQIQGTGRHIGVTQDGVDAQLGRRQGTGYCNRYRVAGLRVLIRNFFIVPWRPKSVSSRWLGRNPASLPTVRSRYRGPFRCPPSPRTIGLTQSISEPGRR
jgi:hypothetical protein